MWISQTNFFYTGSSVQLWLHTGERKKKKKTALEIENEFCVVTLLGVDNTAI